MPTDCVFRLAYDGALPSIARVVNDGGRDGAVDGFALVAEDETMTGVDVPMEAGDRYWVTAPDSDLFEVRVDEREVVIELDARATTQEACERYGRALADRLGALLQN